MTEKRKYKDTDYLYASAYIKSVEDRGLSRALILRMLEAPDAKGALECLLEARGALEGGAGIEDAETLCDELVNDSFRVIGDVTTDPSVFDFMRYQYDCNNIKTSLKCHAKGVSTDGLLFSCGTVPAADCAKMAEQDDYTGLPGAFADAAKFAANAYKKTGDPQSIDLPIDIACLAAMTESAAASGEELLSGAVRLRVDVANVLTVLRVLRMGTATLPELLDRALSPLGSIRKETLVESAEQGEESFFDSVRDRLPRSFGEKLTVGAVLSDVERAADDAYLEYVFSARNGIFGVSVPFIYLTEREYNAKNARIILAGKRAGLPYDDIRSRVRGI